MRATSKGFTASSYDRDLGRVLQAGLRHDSADQVNVRPIRRRAAPAARPGRGGSQGQQATASRQAPAHRPVPASQQDPPGRPGDDMPDEMDMQQLFAADPAQQMQEQLMNAQAGAGRRRGHRDTAGGGLVSRPPCNGQGELMDLSIVRGRLSIDAAVDTDDAEETARTIADLVLAAVRDAYRSAEDLQQQQMGPFAAAMQGGGLPGCPGCRACPACRRSRPARRARPVQPRHRRPARAG
jgi:DNA-binding protein YbaB